MDPLTTPEWYFEDGPECFHREHTDMRFLITYDVPSTSDPRRVKLAHLLEEYGDRIQKSVFECLMETELYEELWKRMEQLVKPREDRVRVYRLCRACEDHIETFGPKLRQREGVDVIIV